MKKLLAIFLLFLVSCGYSLDKKLKNEDIYSIEKQNLSSELEKEDSNSGNILASKENIKQICDTAKVGERFKSLQEKFGNAILLSESELIDGKTSTSYYYGQIGGEMCMILVTKGEISDKNYLSL